MKIKYGKINRNYLRYIMTRKQARELAFKLLYQMDIQKESPQSILDIHCMQKKLDGSSKEYVERILFGVHENKKDIDAKIAALSKDWDVKRLSRVISAVLRLSIFEIEKCDDIPSSVSANEAVELLKTYDSEESAGFANGILATVIRNFE